MTRTTKMIDSEIEALQKERKEVRYQELGKKYAPILDLFEESGLSVAKIKKIFITAFTDEPVSVMIEANSDGEKKIVKEPKEQKQQKEKKSRQPMKFKDKACEMCGKMFTPTSGRQTMCEECKKKDDEEKKAKKKGSSASDK